MSKAEAFEVNFADNKSINMSVGVGGERLSTDINFTKRIVRKVTISNVEDENRLIDDNDIFFIDHFGIAGAYTKEEVAKWTEIEFQPKEYEMLRFHSFTEDLETIQDGRMHTIGVIYECDYNVLLVNVKKGDTIKIGGPAGSPRYKWDSRTPTFSWQPTHTIFWGDGTCETRPHSDNSDYEHTYTEDGIFLIYEDVTNGWWREPITLSKEYSNKGYAVYLRKNITTPIDITFERYACLSPNISSYGSNFLNSSYLEVCVMPRGATTIGTNFAIGARRLKYCVLAPTTNSVSGDYLTKVSSLKLFDMPDDATLLGGELKEMRKIKLSKNYKGDLSIETVRLTDIDIPDTAIITSCKLYVNITKPIKIPDGCTTFSMTWQVKSGYAYIKELHLPSTLTTLNDISAGDVYIAAYTPPTLTYSNTSNQVIVNKFYVPYSEDHSILEAYKAATNWSSFADKIEEIPQ